MDLAWTGRPAPLSLHLHRSDAGDYNTCSSMARVPKRRRLARIYEDNIQVQISFVDIPFGDLRHQEQKFIQLVLVVHLFPSKP